MTTPDNPNARPQKMLPPYLITKDGRSVVEHLTNPKRRRIGEDSQKGLDKLDE
jgi:hypothetical protein